MENQTNNVKISELGNEKIIDLVVPLYKGKNTLIRLLASVVTQTMKDNISVILVQDADGEDYTEILSLFNKMLDIEIIKLENNSGPGTARRIGMKHGKSKYITCMDADDTFQNPFAIQELYLAIESDEFDAVNSVFLEQSNGNVFVPHENDWVWMFGKLYRRKFLEENKIEMNDSRANEDTGFNMVVSTFGKIGYLPDITYIWHYKDDSITRRDGGIYRFTGIEGWLYNMTWAIEKLEKLNLDSEVLKRKVAGMFINTFIWYNEFVIDDDKRVDVNKYLGWVENFVYNTCNKYYLSKDTIREVYKDFSNNKSLVEHVPDISIWEYMKMVGAEYER